VDEYRMETFEHYAHFFRRLDILRSETYPEKSPAKVAGSPTKINNPK